jgi:hypothetical protein
VADVFQAIETKPFISLEKPQDFSRQNISKRSVILHDASALACLGLSRFHNRTLSGHESALI